MSRWQDPRVGTYKSALQKAIRRGEIDGAVSAVQVLLGQPGGRTAVARRLSVIAAEDVGARWIPAVVRVTRTARSETNLDALDDELRAIAAGLASLPKDKTSYWLAATCWGGRREADEVTPDALTNALAAGDHQAAMTIYIGARDQRTWRSGPRIIDALRQRVRDAPELALAIVESALSREGQGGFGIDELAAAAITAAIDRPDGPIPELPTVPCGPPDPDRPLGFEVYDAHTLTGQRVIGRVARRHGMRTRMLADLMFTYESIRLGPSEEGSRWRDEALELDARLGGWVTHSAGERLWRELRNEVRAEIEQEVR